MTSSDEPENRIAYYGRPNPPTFGKTAFDCPYCGVFAQMEWREASARESYAGERLPPNRAHWVQCDHCKEIQYWIVDAFTPPPGPFQDPLQDQTPRITRMVFPSGGQSSAPRAHPDMPEDVRADYDEARAIIDSSVRGACALLRLATEKLVLQHLQRDGGTLNDRIGKLVQNGIAPQIQQGLDTLRVIGNEAVHPAELDLRDDAETAQGLFSILNMMVEEAITRPRHLEEMYAKIPERKREGIEQRDRRALDAGDPA
ncbi:MAG: DUF4145 domain-containing protein [Patulibacter sp.]|nr:DUF4145 domain-containing protein [Patulibacter sp.]